MSLLSQLLQRALVKRPSQVIIETERPVVIITDRGTQEHGKNLGGDAVFDALFDVLSEEQQAELVVGKLVEFDFTAGSRTWHVVTETAADRISLRARLRPQLVEDIPVDDLDELELDQDEGHDEEAREREVELGDELVVVLDADEFGVPARVPGVAYLGGLGEDEIEVELDEPDEAVALASRRAAIGAREASVLAFPRDTGDFESRGKKPASRSREGGRGIFGRFTRRASVERERLVATLAAGTLCYVLRGVGTGEALAEAIDLPILRIREGDSPASISPRLSTLAEDAVVLVTLEDPSPWLPWLLRRLEEGRRVLIETGARTPAGARRVLLGVGATARAESWLACMRTASATRSGGRWNLSLDEL